jgi:D-apionolactonase
MNDLSRPVLYNGKDEVRPNPISLRAGPLTMIFEPDTAFLRYVRVGDHEVVRGVYGAVRDRNWNTVAPRLSNLNVDAKAGSFRLSFDAVCEEGEISLRWKGEIAGDAQGMVTFTFAGEARAAFWRNRIGLCVLHPILECAGKPCVVEHADGSREQGIFPRSISPDQPFKSIRAVMHEPAPGIRAEVRFDGDVFEMEDQRNWTDASFKTYSTPLEIPYPVEIPKGARIEQKVTITVTAERRILPVVQGRGAQLSISTTPVFPKPAIGLAMASHAQSLSAREIERLKRLKLSHLRVDLHLAESSHRSRFRQAWEEAKAIGTRLHAAVFLNKDTEAALADLIEDAVTLNAGVSLWMVFDENEIVTGDALVRIARQKLAARLPNALIAAGTDAYFVEINRERPPADSTALPCYSINPQVHAVDNTTLIENLAAQPLTVESLYQFCKQSPVISPITFKPRFNPDASGAVGTESLDELPSSVDVRQMSLFGAGWTLASISRLATAGTIHSLTYFETTGWRGIMETERGSALPKKFQSRPGSVFPIYFVLASLAGFDRVCPTHSSHPLQVEGLTLIDGANRRRVLAANLLGEPQEIRIKTGTCQARVQYLDETNAEQFAEAPETFGSNAQLLDSVSGKVELKLLPHALAVVDLL